MTTNYDKIKNQRKKEMAETSAKFWITAMLYGEKSLQANEIFKYFYEWLGADADE